MIVILIEMFEFHSSTRQRNKIQFPRSPTIPYLSVNQVREFSFFCLTFHHCFRLRPHFFFFKFYVTEISCNARLRE